MEESEAARVFISYRRQETAWPARQLYDVLVAELGADRIFKDVDNIEPGDDFVERIQSAVGSCEVLLALIGPQWLTVTDANGGRRIADTQDFVRIEVETALNRDDVRVIPILVDNAKMPSPQELPSGLARSTPRPSSPSPGAGPHLEGCSRRDCRTVDIPCRRRSSPSEDNTTRTSGCRPSR